MKGSDLEVIWGTLSRSGSQFVLGLTTRLLGSKLQPQSRISGVRKEGYQHREPSFHELYANGSGVEYFTRHEIRSLKLEDPCNDGFGEVVADAFPDARWVTSIRPIDDVLTSHFNIKRWGHDETYVLRSYRRNLELFERLSEEERLAPIRVDEPASFDPARFAGFFGVPPSQAFLKAVEDWTPINDLRYQKDKWDEAYDGVPSLPPDLDTLRDRHPWLEDVEARYDDLVVRFWE